MIADEIQSGLGRAGARFACDHEDVVPDLYILGKALGGGILPLSAVVGDDEVLGVLRPGEHGSTFGGNPLACAVGREVLRLLTNRLIADSAALGSAAAERLAPYGTVRQRGLWLGIDIAGSARGACERLLELGVLCKDTHETTLRVAPPLTVAARSSTGRSSVSRTCCAASALGVLLALLLAGPARAQEPGTDVLVFTRAETFVHGSIPAGVQALRELGAANDFSVTASDDPAVLEDLDGLTTTRPSSSSRRAATSSIRRRRRRSSATCARAAAGWACTRRRTPSTSGRSTGRCSPAAGSARTRRSSRRRSRSRTARTPPRSTSARAGRGRTSGTRSARARAGWRTCSCGWTSRRTSPATRAWAPSTRSRGAATSGAAGPGSPALGHTAESYAEPAFRRHLLGGVLSVAGRVPADCTPNERDAPVLTAPPTIARRELRRRGLPVRLACPRGCRASLRLAGRCGGPCGCGREGRSGCGCARRARGACPGGSGSSPTSSPTAARRRWSGRRCRLLGLGAERARRHDEAQRGLRRAARLDARAVQPAAGALRRHGRLRLRRRATRSRRSRRRSRCPPRAATRAR